MAKIFLEYGANVNGNELTEKQDTPLIAASSLHADQVAIFYIENGANINHAGYSWRHCVTLGSMVRKG